MKPREVLTWALLALVLIALLAGAGCDDVEAPDACTTIREQIAACGFDGEDFECTPGASASPAIECMASVVVANGCPPEGAAISYVNITSPAYYACVE